MASNFASCRSSAQPKPPSVDADRCPHHHEGQLIANPEGEEEDVMSNLICRRGGNRCILDDGGHVEQVDEIEAKMTNISLRHGRISKALNGR